MSDVAISKYQMIFGWEGDHGIGEMLIQQILKGEKKQRLVLLNRNIQKKN